MKIHRETLLGVSLLIIVMVIGTLVALQQNANRLPPLVSISAAPDGALALKLWVRELGYIVNEEKLKDFQPPGNASIVFMLEPDPITSDELTSIDNFVARGGTLIAAGDSNGISTLARHYGFSLQISDLVIEQAFPQVPLLTSPPIKQAIPINASLIFMGEKPDFVTLLAGKSGPVVVTFESASGRIILCSTPYPFTNQGLKVDGNPGLVLNLLATARQNGLIWFDDWHHGLRSGQQVSGPESWLRNTPAGYAILFVVAVVFLGLLLQGQLFGRPVPLARELRRRGPLDYLTAIANLNRRAGHRTAILDHYRQQVKRHLGHRYRLDPAMPDEEFVDKLVCFNPSVDAATLRELLKGLASPAPHEMDMVKLAAEASHWLEE